MGFSHLSAGKGYDKISGDIERGGKHGENDGIPRRIRSCGAAGNQKGKKYERFWYGILLHRDKRAGAEMGKEI